MRERPKGKWYKLDNAGKLYPAIATSQWNSVFRVSVLLKERVAPEVLQTAVDRVLPRFPAMRVLMRRGFFWYYLEANPNRLVVGEDVGHPCLRFRWKDNNGYLLRVLYYGRRISVEFFHSITDGSGGYAFLETLAAEYLRLKGIRVPATYGVMDLKRKPTPGEVEDAFLRAPLPKVKKPRKEPRAYHFKGQREVPHTLHVIAASIPFAELHQKSKAVGVTVTEYLVAVMLYTAYRDQDALVKAGKLRRQLPLRVSVPVNMRKYFQTETLRNFSYFVNPEIDPNLGEYTFEETVRAVHAFMGYAVNPKFLFAGIATNVADERNLLLRLCPLPLKNLAINTVFRYVGERAMTSTLTSIGRLNAPEAMMAHIERFELMLGASATPCCNCALVSTGDTMLLTFTRNMREATLPREMLRFLVRQGIPVTVESNQE